MMNMKVGQIEVATAAAFMATSLIIVQKGQDGRLRGQFFTVRLGP